jgi:hypothetical protein
MITKVTAVAPDHKENCPLWLYETFGGAEP